MYTNVLTVICSKMIYMVKMPKLHTELVSPSKRYMVIDIGGGTVDITVKYYNEAANKISIVLTPTGNVSGGTTTNKALYFSV